MRRLKLQKGITLIALVVTIIVLIILAGISISMLTGQNGILTRAGEAKTKTDLARIEEQVNLKILEKLTIKGGNAKNTEKSDIDKILEDMKVDYEEILTSGEVTDIEITGKQLLNVNDTSKLTAKYIGENLEFDYFVKINGKYYKVEPNKAGIKIAQTSTNVAPTPLVATSSSSNITVGKTSAKEIPLAAGGAGGGATITVKYGDSITKSYNISVVKKPAEGATPALANGVTATEDLTFSADFGRVEVVWLKDKTNEITTTPNVPLLKAGAADPNPLKPVTWDYYEFGYKEDDEGNTIAFATLEEANDEDSGAVKDEAGNLVQWKEATKAETEIKKTWYNYKAGSGTEDNNLSQWANAKMSTGGVDSYYVWIPRFAYRITYYADETSTEVLGCWDGHGLYDAKTGALNLKNDTGIETTTDGEYIVHPAFGTDLDLGGWYDDDGIDYDGLTGFWVAKYEMSKSGSTYVSIPNVENARNMYIGNTYTKSKLIDSKKESHLMKNSEWGAVALLTHSQYGRNGHEIDINNSTTYITGNGGGNVGGSASTDSGITNAYNTKKGVKASTTGNIYGIYDMSGGGVEYIASFDGESTSINSTYVGDMITNKGALNPEYDAETNASVPKYISTKYITVYRNGSSDSTNGRPKLFEVSKLGDAIKEVRKKSSSDGWYNDGSFFVDSDTPFFVRGGGQRSGATAGVFCSNYYIGYNSILSFRTVLSALAP